MNDLQFDELARRSLSVSHVPSEEAWRNSMPATVAKTRWVPNYAEIAGAAIVVAACLGASWMAGWGARAPEQEPALAIRAATSDVGRSESDYYAVSRMPGFGR